jgi:manganese transport protein
LPKLKNTEKDISLSEVHESIDVAAPKNKWRRFLAFLGPAYLVAVGYMDPGNWAADIEGGSKFGYKLVWVLLMSNIMALVLQSLCARLGIVYKRDLAQANRDTYPKIINIPLYLLAEIAIAATDLAEVLGMAIGLKLLFGLPLLWGVGITVLDTFLLLYLQKLGMRKMEQFIIGLISIIFISFIVLLFISKPEASSIISGLKPTIPTGSLFIIIAIIGATVMPHNLYLHSALVQTRKIKNDEASIRKAIKLNTIDSAVALNLALFVNAAILILAASVFYKNNITVSSIEQAHELLKPLVGKYAPILFAIALISAGQSSTITGTLAGQIVMEGYLQIRINPWLRRLLTRAVAIIPALLTIYFLGESKVEDMLVLSQVILSLQLSFAVIPLIIFVSDKNKMQQFTIKPWLLAVAVGIAAVLIYLNCKLVIEKSTDFLQTSTNELYKALVIIGLLFFFILLIATIVIPFIIKGKKSNGIHTQPILLNLQSTPLPTVIAIALDFSDMDKKVINQAIAQGGKAAQYILIHIVESAGAKILGKQIADQESMNDESFLQNYATQLNSNGYKTTAIIGYRNRINEIARITKECNANLLILGAHGHKGLLDYLYGETINEVRHLVDIPILVVK